MVITLGIKLCSSNEDFFYWGYARSYSVSDVEFGGDYQTYIYDASNTIVDELNDVIQIADTMLDAQISMVNSMYKIGGTIVTAIGLVILAIGLVNIGKAFDTGSVIVTQGSIPQQSNTHSNSNAKASVAPQASYVASEDIEDSSPVPSISEYKVTKAESSPTSKHEPHLPKEEKKATYTIPDKKAGLKEHLNYALQFQTDDGMKRYLIGVIPKLSADEQQELNVILAAPQTELHAVVNDYIKKHY